MAPLLQRQGAAAAAYLRSRAEKLAKLDHGDIEELERAVAANPYDEELRAELEAALAAYYADRQEAALTMLGTEGLVTEEALSAMLSQVPEEAVAWARSRVGNLVTEVSDTTRNGINTAVADALEAGATNAELAAQLTDAYDFSRARALLIARTEANTADSQGTLAGYRASGVVSEKYWDADPEACDVCEANAAQGSIPLDAAFESGDDAPPGHPNAVLSGSRFAPYGQLRQMLASRYDGPAITLEAERADDGAEMASGNAEDYTYLAERDRGRKERRHVAHDLVADHGRSPGTVVANRVRVTIGPNHPMLSRRGWVPASEVREGDELLYDARGIETVTAGEPNLVEMPLVEDAFHALRVAFGNARVAAPRDYFHGDEIFCYGEVQAVWPTRDLLPILDAGGGEQLSECDLAEAYPDAAHVARCGACQARFERVFGIASRAEHGGHASAAFLSGEGTPVAFESVRVIASHKGQFQGWAFDASTEDTIYNSNGFVVKNCECSLGAVVAAGILGG